MKAQVMVGTLIGLAAFALSYLTIHIAYTATINSLKVEDTTPSTLQVKENYGLQTDQGYKLQPATNPQAQ
jgi:hypothetical protein